MFPQTTDVTQQDSDTDASDPFIVHAAVVAGSSFTLQMGPPTVLATVTLSGTLQRVTTAGSNRLLQTNLGASAISYKTLLHNVTHSSYAWPYTVVSGTTFNVSQPYLPQTPGTDTTAAVNTWLDGDSVQVLSPLAVYAPDFSVKILEYNGGFSNSGYVYQASMFTPSGGNFTFSDGVVFYESVFQSIPVNFGSGSYGLDLGNVSAPFGVQGYPGAAFTSIYGGITNSTLPNNNSLFLLNGTAFLDNAIVSGGVPALEVGTRIQVGGTLYLDTSMTLVNSYMNFIQDGVTQPVLFGSGNAAIVLEGTSTLANATGIAFNTLITAAPLRTCVDMNDACTSCRVLYDGGFGGDASAGGALQCGVQNTPANFDTTSNSPGYFGKQFMPGGAGVSILP